MTKNLSLSRRRFALGAVGFMLVGALGWPIGHTLLQKFVGNTDVGTTELYCGNKVCGRMTRPKQSSAKESICLITSSSGVNDPIYVPFSKMYPWNHGSLNGDASFRGSRFLWSVQSHGDVEDWCDEREDEGYGISFLTLNLGNAPATPPDVDGHVVVAKKVPSANTVAVLWHPLNDSGRSFSCPRILPVNCITCDDVEFTYDHSEASLTGTEFKSMCDTLGYVVAEFNIARQ